MVGNEGGVVSEVTNLESSGVEAPDRRPRHDERTTKPDSSQPASETAVELFDNWFDPIETEVRDRVREFIEGLMEEELDEALARPRYGRSKKAADEGGGGCDRSPPRPPVALADSAPSARSRSRCRARG